MVEEATEMDEVIVTGYVPKAKNSFTGTAVQVKGDDLRKVNPTNLFAALKVFDPSFAVLDDEGMFGSDPNRVPDKIEIRARIVCLTFHRGICRLILLCRFLLWMVFRLLFNKYLTWI